MAKVSLAVKALTLVWQIGYDSGSDPRRRPSSSRALGCAHARLGSIPVRSGSGTSRVVGLPLSGRGGGEARRREGAEGQKSRHFRAGETMLTFMSSSSLPPWVSNKSCSPRLPLGMALLVLIPIALRTRHARNIAIAFAIMAMLWAGGLAGGMGFWTGKWIVQGSPPSPACRAAPRARVRRPSGSTVSTTIITSDSASDPKVDAQATSPAHDPETKGSVSQSPSDPKGEATPSDAAGPQDGAADAESNEASEPGDAAVESGDEAQVGKPLHGADATAETGLPDLPGEETGAPDAPAPSASASGSVLVVAKQG